MRLGCGLMLTTAFRYRLEETRSSAVAGYLPSVVGTAWILGSSAAGAAWRNRLAYILSSVFNGEYFDLLEVSGDSLKPVYLTPQIGFSLFNSVTGTQSLVVKIAIGGRHWKHCKVMERLLLWRNLQQSLHTID
jgi:hypothetical protein